MKLPKRDKPIPEGPYDLAIVGGGINGTAIARDAVMRGHSVVLFEKNDLASGTSGNSSKMIHGGLRYLEQFRLGLVHESLRERHLLLRLAPHLVKRQTFLLPVYEGARRGPRWIQAGLWLYDKLCLGRKIGKSAWLSADEVLARVPDIVPDALIGGGLYWDAVMDDARIVVVNALGAEEEAQARSSPFFLRTYSEVVETQLTSPVRLVVEDRITGAIQRVLAYNVVYAQGPWTDQELLAPSKGTHIVMPPFPSHDGLLLQNDSDRRVFFVVPWRGHTIVGTTETPYEGSPDGLRATGEDVEYLLAGLKHHFPKITFGPQDILGVYAGIRPLARRTGWLSFWKNSEMGSVSREHRIVSEGNAIHRVFGGKYTTYRVIAKQVVDRVFPGSVCETHRRPLPGGEEDAWSHFRPSISAEDVERFGETEVERLYLRYGCRSREIFNICREDPSLADPLSERAPEIKAEVVYAVRREFVHTPGDFLCRRTTLRYSEDGGRQAYDRVQGLMERQNRAPLPDPDAQRKRYFEDREWEDELSGRVPAAT